MPNYTNNLNLLKKDPATEGNDYFNIETMLNENWDKIDAGVTALNEAVTSHEGEITQLENEVQNSVPVGTVSLSNTSSVTSIDAKVNSGLDFEMEAQPLVVNLLGRDGDCEGLSNFTAYNSTLSLDTTNKIFGSNCIKSVPNTNYLTLITANSLKSYIAGKKVFVSVYLKTNVAETPTIRISNLNVGGATSYAKSFELNTTTNMTRYGAKFDLSDSADYELYLWIIKSNPTATEMYVDGIMVNLITDDEYNNSTVDQLFAKYPYVNGIQPMMGLNVKSCGKNLFDNTINNWEQGGTLSTIGIEAAKTVLTTQLRPVNLHGCSVKAGSQYTISSTTFGAYKIAIRVIDRHGILLYAPTSVAVTTTFTMPANSAYLIPLILRVDGGTITPIEIINVVVQIEEGTAATTYEPYQGSELLIDGEFAGMGTYLDKLVYENGVAKKLANVKKVVLDGSLAWEFSTDGTTFKRVRIPVSNSAFLNETYACKYDGTIINKIGTTAADMLSWDTANAKFNITVADTESGWGESYTPFVDEIKALMNGWKMNNGTFGTLYNGTGTKTWTKWDATDNTNAVAVCPTTKADGWTGWATLWYVLVTPTDEILNTPINGLSMYEGKTTISLATGIVKEKANPTFYETKYYINFTSVAGSLLNCKAKKILYILKNKVIDNNWNIGTINVYGLQGAYCETVKFDTTAIYDVLYEVLHEEYDSHQVALIAEYTENLRDSHNELVKTISNLQVDVAGMEANLTTVTDDVIAHMAKDATTSAKGHVQLGNTAGMAAEGNHGHEFSSITGTVSVAQGGTGQTTLAAARNAMGLGNTTGALPIANGGTGVTTAAAALTALGITATAAELNYVDGVTSNIQTQLNAKLGLSSGTMSGELNCADNLLTRPYIKDYAEAKGITPATTGTVTLDLTTGNTFEVTPTGAITFSITNPPANGRVGSFTLQINMPSTLYAMTFTASFKWDNDVVPTFTASKTAIITGYTLDGGTKWRVSSVGTNFTT